jgi:hypothetical protein
MEVASANEMEIGNDLQVALFPKRTSLPVFGGRRRELHSQNSEIGSDDLDRKNQDRTQEACRCQGQADASKKTQKARQTLRLVNRPSISPICAGAAAVGIGHPKSPGPNLCAALHDGLAVYDALSPVSGLASHRGRRR